MWLAAADLTLLLAASTPGGAAEYVCAGAPRPADCLFEASFPAEQVVRFDLESHVGDVHIRADEATGKVVVRAAAVGWHEGCGLEMAQDRERGFARVDGDFGVSAPCRVDFVIVVHPHTRLTVRVGKGDVKLSGLANDFTADLGNGDLEIEGITGALDAEIGNGQLAGLFAGPRIHVEMGSGEVHLHGLVAPAAVSLGMGNIELTFAEAPVGSIDARTGTGAVRILLPPETPVAAAVVVGSGSKFIRLPQVEDAPTRIDASADVGKVSVVPVSYLP